MSDPTSELRDPDLLNVGIALHRAALKARELARQTGTPCYVWRDGQVVDVNALDRVGSGAPADRGNAPTLQTELQRDPRQGWADDARRLATEGDDAPVWPEVANEGNDKLVWLQAAIEALAALRVIAEAQGRQFQAVLDEALRDYIDRQQKERPRRHVMAAFASSLDEFDSLYRELAK